MKGKLVAAAAAASNGGKGNQTDLLVCFPSRARLALMPKPICSPSRPPELPKRHLHHHHHHSNRHQHGGASATTTKPAPPAPTRRNAGGGSHRKKNSSPLFKGKARDRDVEEELDEPTSPRITCAGQIRVRPSSVSKARSSSASSSRPSTEGRDWVSVMEEIERMRKDGKTKKSSGGGGSWLEAIGIKKDALQMFSSFHGLRFNMGCFGSFPGSTIDCTSDDDEEEDDRDQEASGSNPNDVFSKWFMLIEENHDTDLKEEIAHDEDEDEDEEEKEDMKSSSSVVPPPNALLLMRCRSAPAKGLIINRAEQLETEETRMSANKALRDEEDQEEEEKEKERLVVMRCAPDFFKVSMDIAKETWVVGGELDLLARSRSCRR